MVRKKCSCINCINLKTRTFLDIKTDDEVNAVIAKRVDEFGFCKVFYCSKGRLNGRKYVYVNRKLMEDKVKLNVLCKDYV